ncbi:MAG: methyltransferase [Egibacteraceae bacterium]
MRLLPLADEADILERNLRWYADAGIATVAFDNASTDGTAELAERAREAGALAGLRRSQRRIEWSAVSRGLLELANDLDPDLVLVAGADEFIETADGTELRKAIESDLRRDLDILVVDTMEFCLTEEDGSGPDPIARMSRYSPYRAILRDRGVRWSRGVTWPEAHKLRVSDPSAQRSTRRYVNRHYPLRSVEQALARARDGRLGRAVLAGNSAAALSPLAVGPTDLLVPGKKLARYEGDHQWMAIGNIAELRLTKVATLARRATAESTKLQAQLAGQRKQLDALKQRYTGVLLERDRLMAAGAAPVAGHLAAPAGWYDEHYRLTLDKYDIDAADSVYRPVWEVIVSRIDPTATVLELGCGTGQLGRMLIDRGLAGYCGFDFSEVAVELARKRIPGLEVEIADARTTRLVIDFSYDTALCTEVLEHLDDDMAVLRRIRPGTRMLATVPNFDSTSHLRYFADEQEVVQRYQSVLDNLEVTRIELPHGSVIFLLDGVAAEPVRNSLGW